MASRRDEKTQHLPTYLLKEPGSSYILKLFYAEGNSFFLGCLWKGGSDKKTLDSLNKILQPTQLRIRLFYWFRHISVSCRFFWYAILGYKLPNNPRSVLTKNGHIIINKTIEGKFCHIWSPFCSAINALSLVVPGFKSYEILRIVFNNLHKHTL